jgi:hypothetical protein
VHRSTWSLLERGRLDSLTLRTLRGCLAVLEVRLDLRPRWRGAEVDRILDDRHSTVAAGWKRRLEQWGWHVSAEVSFNHYGDRGRVDLLAWHPRLRILLVVEVKTEIVDVQAMLGALDVKVRLGSALARRAGWPSPAMVIPVLIVVDTPTNRRRIRRVDSLFAHLPLRGRSAISWLREPRERPGGLLVVSSHSSAGVGRVRAVGSHRVRLSRAGTSVNRGDGAA